MPKQPSTADQILRQLQAQAAEILAEGVVLSSFKHKGLSGIEREEPVRRFLRTHLPGRFHIGQGAIASSEEILEQQHDIVIADRDACFLLLNTLSAQLFTIESVHLIVEVRSRANELKTVAKSLRAVRNLRPSVAIREGEKGDTAPGVHTLVIYQGPQKTETLIGNLKKANTEKEEKERRLAIDFILVLAKEGSQDPSSGYLIGYDRIDEQRRQITHHYYPKCGEVGLDGPKVIREGVCSFPFWYAAVLNHLNGVTAYPPFLYSYIGKKVTIMSTTADES